MKNKKLILVFSLIIALLLVLIPVANADEGSLNILNNLGNGTSNDETTNNETTNNEVGNNQTTTIPPIIGTTNNTTNNTDNTAQNNLPQTGVADNTALIVFVAICVVSAIYAYIKIRNYKNI